MKRILSLVVFITASLVFSNSFAMNIDALLYANNSTVDARVAYLEKIDYGMMEAGIEGTYKSDEYKLMSLDLGVKSDDFLPGSRYKLGFRGVYADAEKNDDLDSQLTSLCFVLGIEQDLSSNINPVSIPISFGAEVSFSPEPLTWGDGEDYLELRANMNFHIMGNASVILEYRYLEAEFEDDGHNWEKEDHNFLFGYRIRF